MDPNFTKAIADLTAMQERANEEHRVAMVAADRCLATLGGQNVRVMTEADQRLDPLGHEQQVHENDARLRAHVGAHEQEMAEADRRLRNLENDRSEGKRQR
ncbi:hypothetical protein F5Y16DRAFT_393928 [Xylariaceae sp. FL0255]|nr:hypothetical protein F5Y16DRAFT_393928 [Xylariaceae sp. FL0255]